MAIAKITKGKKSKRLLKYLFDEKPKTPHEGLEGRVLFSSSQNVDLSVKDYERLEAQYKALRELSGKADKNHQIYHVVQSFAKDEFDYKDSLQVMRANELGLLLGKEIASEDAQIVVVTQADNESGLVHNHIVLGGVLMDGKSLQTNNVSVKNIRAKNDQVLKSKFMSQHENIKNEEVAGRKTVAERAINDRGELTKKDIMRLKLDFAMSEAKSVDELEMLLQENDVELIHAKRKKADIFKYKEDGESKAMTDRALGEKYSIDNVLRQIALNAAREKEKEKEDEEREKAEKQREIEESVVDADDQKTDDIELVQESKTIQEPTKKSSLDLLFEEAKSVNKLSTRKSGYSGSRVEPSAPDIDLEL